MRVIISLIIIQDIIRQFILMIEEALVGHDSAGPGNESVTNISLK